MADEPTWDDLFGEPLPPKPSAPPPAEQQVAVPPVAQQPPVQQPPVQQQPVQSAPVYPPAVAAPLQQPTYQAPPSQATYQVPHQQQYQVPPQRASSPPASVPPMRSDSRGTGSRRGGYQPQKPKRKLTWLWILIVLVVLGAGGSGVVYAAFGPQIRHVLGWEPSIDYTGSGDGETTEITIQPGQFGSDVAASLAKAGVTKTSQAFYDLLLKQKPAPVFEPGTYKLQQQMSAKSALAALSNSANRVVSKVVIPEGYNLSQVEARLSAKTGVKLSDLQTAAANYKQFKLPAGAPSLEGFLFPATYQFSPGTTAVQELQAMVTRMNQALTQHKVPAASELKVLTLASIIQKEAASQPDFYKVSRVFTNRLADNMALQSDATVSYGAHSKSIFTTGAQRADASNKYNTYAHTGLPIGPIAAPGDTAIDAALHPAAGPWLYFVLVNGDTGQTVFSTTIAGQDAAVKQWQTWLKAHPGYGN
ncbi:MAG TPA: endolytic transglycosylase MltG [Galbitalea sp.]|nr:endolytic transglycosylase MltG [Galbitalea sp.]